MTSTRRAILSHALAAGAGLGSPAAIRQLVGDQPKPARGEVRSRLAPSSAAVPFYGPHQAGILTSPQTAVDFTAYDVQATSRQELRDLLRAITTVARGLTDADDTRLTITMGLGPRLFDPADDRYTLAALRPAPLVSLPAFAHDRLDPARSNGDLALQVCSDDPLTAFHAQRILTAAIRGAATRRWTQTGTRQPQATAPRNIIGFHDGIANPATNDPTACADHVWAAPTDQAWMQGGSYLVVRTIRVLLEQWDEQPLEEQERTIGRRQDSSARLSAPIEGPRPHIYAANPDAPGLSSQNLLRRSYAYNNGVDPTYNEYDAGQLFLCYQPDPRRHFVPIQQRLSDDDLLSTYIVHTASALFAIPPGATATTHLAQSLFNS